MRTKKKCRDWKNERGVSLFIALISLLTITMLANALILVTRTETATTANYTLLAQARYAAEAGVQQTINWLNNNYTAPTTFTSYNRTTNPVRCVSGCTTNGAAVVLSGLSDVASNYPDSTLSAAYTAALSNQTLPGLSTASFSTSATLVSMSGGGVSWIPNSGPMQTWQITSRGTIAGINAATVELKATYERQGTPAISYAVFATGTTCPTISFGGGGLTDSYDSSQGSYAATVQNTRGDIGTNGTLSMTGNSVVNGNAYLVSVQTTGSCPAQTFNNSSSVGVTGNGGTPIAMGSPKTMPDPVYSNPSPALTTSTSYTVNVSLSPGNYNNVSISAGKTLTLSPGTYNFNSLTLSGNSVLTVSPAGRVVLQIAGAGTVSNALDFSGGSLTNSGGVPADFQIVYQGSKPITLSGGTQSAAVIYAPHSAIAISGGAPWYGSIVAASFTDSGGAAVHYDRDLSASITTTGPFRAIGFSWSKF